MPQIMDTPGVPDKFKPKVRALTDHIGRGTQPNRTNSEKVEALRRTVLENRDLSLDDNLLKLAPKRTGKVRAIRATGRSGMRMPWGADDDQFLYHRTSASNLAGLRERGTDPSLAKRGSFGTHAAPDPEHTWSYADDVNSSGDESIMLRTRRTPDWTMHDPQDFSTRRAIPANQWEVLGEGPSPAGPGVWGGLSNAYGAGSGAKGLYDLLSSFMPGVLPQIQTPADWIIQELMRTSSASPWNPQNQPGYTVPA